MNQLSWKAQIIMNKLTTKRPSRIPRLLRSGKTEEVTYVSRHSVLCGGSKPRWGLEVATQVVNKRLHAWQQADEENYMKSSEEIGEHMQEFHSCMTECDRIELALAKLSNFQEAELSGSTKQDCNLEEKLKQEEPEARNNVNETLEENMLNENKPCEAAAGSDELESAQAEKKLSGVDSKTTHCLEEKLRGKLLHYRELKQDLVVILDWYKKQIEAAHDYLEDSWGDAFRKVIVDIKWL